MGTVPEVPKAVVIAVPHTSNWDGIWALIYKIAIGLDVRFFAKHSLFWFPLGTLLRRLGGIPLDRAHATSAVDQAVALFSENERFYFALAPEGTRAKTDGWKSGFYRIAVAANVPVILGFLDYGSKRIGLGPITELSGDVGRDLPFFREFYASVKGCRPDKTSPVAFPPGTPKP